MKYIFSCLVCALTLTGASTHTNASGSAHPDPLPYCTAATIPTQALTSIATDFITCATLALLANARVLYQVAFPHPAQLGMYEVKDIPPKQRTLFNNICKKFALDPNTITIKQCSRLSTTHNTEMLSAGTSLILVDATTQALSQEEYAFALAHELAHIRHNDIPKRCAVDIGTSISALILSSHACEKYLTKTGSPLTRISGLFGCMALSWWIGEQAKKRYSRHQEKKADITAVTKLGSKKGALAWLQRNQQENITAQQQRMLEGEKPEDIGVDAVGNNLHDTHHPLLSERIAYINAL